MDVCALYPLISKKLAYDTIIKNVKKSKIPWDSVDTKELGRFLALTVERSELKRHKINDCVPTAKGTTTLNSWVNPKDRARITDGDNQFVPSVRQPTVKDIRTMIAIAIATSVVTCMSNHYYSFGGDLRKQSDG